jgi:nitrogen regulatory protein P-II 1
MTKVEAIIRPDMLDAAKAALDILGFHDLIVMHVVGTGRHPAITQRYRGAKYVVNLLDKLKIETIVQDDRAREAMEAIADAVSGGEIEDGRILAYKVDSVMSIRTRKVGEAVLT